MPPRSRVGAPSKGEKKIFKKVALDRKLKIRGCKSFKVIFFSWWVWGDNSVPLTSPLLRGHFLTAFWVLSFSLFGLLETQSLPPSPDSKTLFVRLLHQESNPIYRVAALAHYVHLQNVRYVFCFCENLLLQYWEGSSDTCVCKITDGRRRPNSF